MASPTSALLLERLDHVAIVGGGRASAPWPPGQRRFASGPGSRRTPCEPWRQAAREGCRCRSARAGRRRAPAASGSPARALGSTSVFTNWSQAASCCLSRLYGSSISLDLELLEELADPGHEERRLCQVLLDLGPDWWQQLFVLQPLANQRGGMLDRIGFVPGSRPVYLRRRTRAEGLRAGETCSSSSPWNDWNMSSERLR